jgi:signal peptidase I
MVHDSIPQPNVTRETLESVLVAIILALLFRTFIGEAFVIPTGSMAPTLMGNHKDVQCNKCGFAYQANASSENEEIGRVPDRMVVATTCPICRHFMPLNLEENPNHQSFTGDRILVSKFSYDLQDPRRWDVIVFKYPNNAKQNYIKRLVGLPGETIRIRHGDVFTRREGEADFQIARKPPHKLLAMLQVVDDTNHISDELASVRWPSRWQPWSATGNAGEWRETGLDRAPIQIQAKEGERWLRYRHLVPESGDWAAIEANRPLEMPQPGEDTGELITDFYAYNAFATTSRSSLARKANRDSSGLPHDVTFDDRTLGHHWVGDLAFEGTLEFTDSKGMILLDLIEAGVHHRCRIDVATGVAELVIEHGNYTFSNERGEPVPQAPKATTAIRGPGKYSVRFSNIDDEIRLWVNEKLVEFDQPTTYVAPADQQPFWSEKDAGDLAPVGIGADGLTLKATGLRVLRDVYYIATDGSLLENYNPENDYPRGVGQGEIQNLLRSPHKWASSTVFARRRSIDFRLEADQFFPMGDNSPQSKDGRLWGDPPYVDRSLLTGKAVLVYWPHMWNSPPGWPNFRAMRMIR